MSLLTVSELRALVRTDKGEFDLQPIIDREEAALVSLYGAHFVTATTVTETLAANGLRNLYLRRALTSVSTVKEYATLDTATPTTLTAISDYRAFSAEGRIQRMPTGSTWGALVEVAYIPADDNAERRAVLIDLCRLAVERTAMKSESVAGEYSYQAPDWEAARSEILRRIGFMNV